MALRDINMIPGDYLAQRYVSRHLRFWLVLFSVTLGTILAIYVFHALYILPKNRNAASGKQLDAQLLARLDDIRHTREKIESLQNKHKDLEGITHRRFYFETLEIIADSLDISTWVTSLEIRRDEDESVSDSIEFSGFSMSNQTLGESLKAITGAPGFTGVILTQAEKTVTGEASEPDPVIRFTISSRLSKGTDQ